MISKEYGKTILSCDVCGTSQTFDTFGAALDYINENNWGKDKIKNEWVNYCDKCVMDMLDNMLDNK